MLQHVGSFLRWWYVRCHYMLAMCVRVCGEWEDCKAHRERGQLQSNMLLNAVKLHTFKQAIRDENTHLQGCPQHHVHYFCRKKKNSMKNEGKQEMRCGSIGKK